nr:SDR family NAD(P)-dependent oxidoreductase [Synechococcus sp. PCC 7336]
MGETNCTTALVVGASRGIGLGFVRQLLEQAQFKTIFATYRHADRALELLELRDRHPDLLACIAADVTDERQIEAAVAQIGQRVERLHLAIHCVGILHDESMAPEKSLRQIETQQLARYFQVNSIPAVLWAKHLLPLFKHGDRSVLACISAKVGSIDDNHLGGWYGYRASKAALNMLMRTAAIEYRRKSPETLVALLHPGTTDTELSQPFQANVPPEKLFSVNRTVTQLLEVIAGLGQDDSGQFFSWDGSRLPW